MSRLICMVFGDIICNNSLSRDNPEYCGVFVQEIAKSSNASKLKMTDTKGRFWEFMNDRHSRLEVNGNLDFEAYLQDYDNKLKAVANG